MSKHNPDLSRTRLQAPSRALLRVAQRFSLEFPILDAGCGFGRNAVALAELGFTVICAERDIGRLDALMKVAPTDNLAGALLPVRTELGSAAWPFARACFSAIVFVHYLDTLLPSVRPSLAGSRWFFVFGDCWWAGGKSLGIAGGRRASLLAFATFPFGDL